MINLVYFEVSDIQNYDNYPFFEYKRMLILSKKIMIFAKIDK